MTDVVSIAPNPSQGSTEPAPITTAPQSLAQQVQKLKVDWEDGNAEELTPEDLISNYKLSKKQAAELRKQMDPVMGFLAGLQNGDLDSLYNLNVPEDKMLGFAERILTKKLEWEQLSPEQKSFIQREKDVEERERKFKEWDADRLNKEALSQVQNDIVEAIKDLGLTKKPSPRLVRRIAEQLKAQLEAQKPMDAKRASKHEWQTIQDELRDFQMSMLEANPEKFVENLPKEIRKAIRDYEIKAGTPFKRAETSESNESKGGVLRDFDYLENLYGNKPKRRMK